MNSKKTSADTTTDCLRGQLLIAMPGLVGSTFANTVVYICEHTDKGAWGLTVNKQLGAPVSEIFDQFELGYSEYAGARPLLLGGPVHRGQGFVLHRREDDREWEATVAVDEQVNLTASRDIIEAIAADQGPSDNLIILGCAGWSAGQLEEELLANAWLTVPTDADFLFNAPFDQRVAIAAARIGVDLSQLSTSAGHA